MLSNVKRKNPNALRSVYERLGKLAAREIAVGYPAGKAGSYLDGTRVVDVAASNVFGLGVPVRDFMAYARTGIIEGARPFLAALAQYDKSSAPADAQKAELFRIAAGEEGAAAIKAAIIEGDYQENADYTIKRKGEGKAPLIDTYLMQRSATYVVRDREAGGE